MTEDFADIVYSFLLERLDVDEKGSTLAARNALDRELGVDVWKTPFTKRVSRVRRAQQGSTEVATPGWWRGDDDASQAFLQSMGVRMAGDG